MLESLQQRLALSPRGARDFVKGTAMTTLLNLALMLPAVFVFIFLDEYLLEALEPKGTALSGFWHYTSLALVFMGITWLLAIGMYRSTYTSIYSESANRRLSLAEKIRKLPLAFFGEKNLSDLTSTIMNDNTELEHTFSHAVPQLFASIIALCLMFTGLFFYQPQLTLALFWPVPIAALVIFLSKRHQTGAHKTVYNRSRAVSEQIQEGLETIQEIKSYRLESSYMGKLNEKLDAYERDLTKGELIGGACVVSAQSLLKLGIVSVIVVGAMMLFGGGNVAAGSISVFTYLIFLLIASRIYEPVNQVFMFIAVLFYLDIRINRMREMEAMPIQSGRTTFEPAHFDIEFENVSFAYDEKKQVMKDVSFVAKQGEITALVGPSGGGKSTSARLAARFWDVTEGKILLGGHNISNVDPETLLQHYSVVFQDVVLFNTTVLENIRIGRKGASDEDVLRVAKLAQCDEFVNMLPDGYQTIISENGENLSGGERQRISIARALLKDAPIVILDEATASLDVENETLIQKAISALIKDKTVLVIAHRMRTVANAHKIIVLKDGQVAESGSPDALRKKDGIFARMLQRQKAEMTALETETEEK
jgi:ATP-binding cassette, subfamily B, bacterial IrtB/YbtQ